MSKIIIENKRIEDIPVNEFYIEDYPYKGLVFVQHGYGSNKERGGDYLAIKIARAGFFVVCIDSYMHGERKEGPFVNGTDEERMYYVPSIIRKTALDIIKLHKTHYKEYQTFDLVGVSLGGMIAYYASTKTDCINKLVPTISTPKVTKQAYNILIANGVNPEEYFTEETRNYLHRIDPFTYVNDFKFNEMFILNGTKDPVVSTQDSKEYFETFQQDNMTMKLYEVAHDVNHVMQKDIVEFLCN